MSEPTWRTRDGAQLPIKLMTTSHLLAAIHFIERKRAETLTDLGQVDLEVGVTADVIEYYARWPDAYFHLLEEAERRQVIGRRHDGRCHDAERNPLQRRR